MKEATEQIPSPDYVTGFNEGYIISEHFPDIAKGISAAENKSERTSGFKDGRDQYIFEQNKDRYPAWLKRDITPANDNKKTPGRDNKSPDKE